MYLIPLVLLYDIAFGAVINNGQDETNIETQYKEKMQDIVGRERYLKNDDDDERQREIVKMKAKFELFPMPKSCEDIKLSDTATTNDGIYMIFSRKSKTFYPVFCEMKTDNGGWTLVASVHRNQTGNSFNNKWSKANGFYGSSWMDAETFGLVETASSDDYKNRAFYEIEAKQLMIMQVPNDTPPLDYANLSENGYVTTSYVLEQYGGNLKTLFESYPLRGDTIASINGTNNIPVMTTQEKIASSREHIKFLALNAERNDVYPICVYTSNQHYTCLGGFTAATRTDISVMDNNSDTLQKSAYMIFYR